MTYYPKSQIKTNLYTNGRDYVLSTTSKPNTGYFYQTSNGNKYTGKTPQDSPNILLLIQTPSGDSIFKDPFSIEVDSSSIIHLDDGHDEPLDPNPTPVQNIYSYPNNNYSSLRSIPTLNLTLPTSQDYKFGEFQRYFAKKNNELRYLEIDKQTYTLLQNRDTAIAWDLYTPITVTWELSGDEEKTYNINKNMVNLVERNNKWYGFTQWFKDKFLKYYLAS